MSTTREGGRTDAEQDGEVAFPTVVRGYERHQVDRFVAHQQRLVRELRATLAETKDQLRQVSEQASADAAERDRLRRELAGQNRSAPRGLRVARREAAADGRVRGRGDAVQRLPRVRRARRAGPRRGRAAPARGGAGGHRPVPRAGAGDPPAHGRADRPRAEGGRAGRRRARRVGAVARAAAAAANTLREEAEAEAELVKARARAEAGRTREDAGSS